MNSVMMNAQPLKSSLAVRRNLAFKSEEQPQKPVDMSEPEDQLELSKTDAEEAAAENKSADKPQKPEQAKNEEKKTKSQENPENKRKFSLENAWHQFGAGLISPIKVIFDHGIGGMVAAAGTGAVSLLALNTKLGKKVSPFLMIAFAAIGGVKIGKGMYDIATNGKNPEKQEAAFNEIGQGTVSTVIAIAGSKTALKAADPTAKTKSMGYFEAFGQIFKRSREFGGNVLKQLEKPINTAGKAAKATTGTKTAATITTAETSTNLPPSSPIDAATTAATQKLMPKDTKVDESD
jgi:hypothetical protein